MKPFHLLQRTFLLALPITLCGATSSAQSTFVQDQRLMPSLQNNSTARVDLSVDGDVAVLGGSIPTDIGSAVVYERSGGVWAEATVLTPSVPGSMANLAVLVAVSGETIATAQRVNNAVDIYERLNGAWTHVQRIAAPAPGGFGGALSLSGDTLLVGAPDTPSALGGQVGAGYVYREISGIWTLEQTIIPPTADDSDLVGASVAIDGDTLILGAEELGPSGPLNGSAYVYVRSGSTWTQEARLMASDGAILNGFGTKLDLDGDRAVVVDFNGTAYLFERSGTTWTELQKLIPFGPQPFGAFYFPSISGDVVVLADPNDNASGGVSGTIAVFSKNGASWKQTQELFPSDPSSTYFSFGGGSDLAGGQLLAWANGGVPPTSLESVFTFTLETELYALSCFGDIASETPGCVQCPCSNAANPFTLGGCLNSTLRGARLRAAGTASATSDSLELNLTSAARDTFALLFSGSDLLPQGNATCPPGSGVLSTPVIDGLRCVGSGASIVRLGVRATNSDGDSTTSWGGGVPASGLIALGGFAVGETRHFQCFYRDNLAAFCGTGQNSTNAVTVVVQP